MWLALWAPDALNDERFLAIWPRVHALGFWRFALIRVAIWSAFALVFIGPGFLLFPLYMPATLFFVVAGLSFIPFTWRRHQARYRRLRARTQATAFD